MARLGITHKELLPHLTLCFLWLFSAFNVEAATSELPETSEQLWKLEGDLALIAEACAYPAHKYASSGNRHFPLFVYESDFETCSISQLKQFTKDRRITATPLQNNAEYTEFARLQRVVNKSYFDDAINPSEYLTIAAGTPTLPQHVLLHATLFLNTYQLDEASVLINDAIQHANTSQVLNNKHMLDYLLIKANVEFAGEHYVTAYNTMQQWYKRFSNTPDATPTYEGLALLGFSSLLAGDYGENQALIETGRVYLETALTLCQDARIRYPTSDCFADIKNGLATYYRIKKDYPIAAQIIVDAIGELERLLIQHPKNMQLKRLLADFTHNSSRLMALSGQLAKSQHFLRRSIYYDVELNNLRFLSLSYTNLGFSYVLLGDYDKGEQYLNKALKVSEHLKHEVGIGDAKYQLGKLFLLKNQYDQALQALEESAPLIQQHLPKLSNGVKIRTLFARAKLGTLDDAQFDELRKEIFSSVNTVDIEDLLFFTQTSIAYSKPSVTNSLIQALHQKTIPNVSDFLRLNTIKIQVIPSKLSDNAKIKRILILFEEAMQRVIQTLYTLQADELGLNWTQQAVNFIDEASTFLVQIDDIAAHKLIWTMHETINAAVHQQRRYYFSQAKSSDGDLDITQELNKRAKITKALLKSARPDSTQTQDTLQFELNKAKDIYLAQKHYKEAEITANDFGVIDIDQVQTKLSDGTALIKYITVDEQYYRFTVTKNKWHFDLLHLDAKSIAAEHKQANLLIRDELLSDKTLQGLIILPTADLHKTSFSQLFNDNTYIGEKYTLTRTPSASLYFHTSKKDNVLKDRKKIAIVANPTYQQNIATDKDFNHWYKNFKPLPWTGESAIDIQKLFANGDALVYTEQQATASIFFNQDVRNAGILHVGMHGFVSDTQQDFIGLVTAKVNTGSDIDDLGFLSIDDLLLTPFNADLAVLSTCESEMGRFYGGQGTKGLAYSFLAQGVGSTIGTLWEVPDKPTATFMLHYYKNLFKFNGDSTKALQASRQKFIRSGRYKHPKYWAGFILTSTHSSFTHHLSVN